MRREFFSVHFVEKETQVPAGGMASGRGFCISWQNGPLGKLGMDERQEPNGAFVETVLGAVIDRIEAYQLSPFQCEENAEALKYLRGAAAALDKRTKRREAEGIEGTYEGK